MTHPASHFRTLRLLAVVLVVNAVVACSDNSPIDSVTGPNAPVNAEFMSAVLPNGTTPAASERQASEELARALAMALSDPQIRQEIKAALATSGIREGKLDFSSFIAGRGASILSKVTVLGVSNPVRLASLIRQVRGLELYMPVHAHRDAWKGGADVMVGVMLRQAETPVAFDISGTRHVLDIETPPAQPVLMLNQIETEFGPQVPANLSGRSLANCSVSAAALQSSTVTEAMNQCVPRAAGNALAPKMSFASSPGGQGLFASFFRVMDAHEPWPLGDPELEVHVTAKRSRADGAAQDIQCIGEHAVDATYQPGIRDQQYVYDQNGNFWDGLVLFMNPEQIDNAAQSESRGYNITIWEDDDTACKIKQKSSGDYLKQALAATASVSSGIAGIFTQNWVLVAGSFGSAAQDFFNLFTGDDDYVGDLVPKESTQWASEFPDNNYIIMDHATFNGRATLLLDSTTPSDLPVISVLVTPNAPDNLPPGGAVQMDARGYDTGGRYATESSRTWSSSNPGVASVAADGALTAVSEGTATITATINGVAGSTTSIVYGPMTSVSITPSSAVILVNQGVYMIAQGRDGHGTAVAGSTPIWTSSDESVAIVDATGYVSAISDGGAMIQATIDGISGMAGVNVESLPPCPPPEIICSMSVPQYSVKSVGSNPKPKTKAIRPRNAKR